MGLDRNPKKYLNITVTDSAKCGAMEAFGEKSVIKPAYIQS